MKKYPLYLIVMLTFYSLSGGSNPIDYRKGIYLRTDIVAGSQFDSLLVKSKQAGINAVVFDIKDMKGRIYINIDNCPTMISKKDDLKINLKNTIDKIHQANMKAIARIVAFHNSRTAQADSSFCPADSLGKRWIENTDKGPQWLDPSNIIVQKDLFSLIDIVVEQSIDEIQFDYIRFPTQGNIENAVFEFMRVDERRYFADTTFIKRTKSDIIEEFLRNVKLRYADRNIYVTADIFAIVCWQNSMDIEQTGQDLVRMSRYLDALHPMLYSSHFADNFGYRENVHNEPFDIVFKGIMRTKQKINHNCKVIPYIQANSWQVNYRKEYIAAQVAACKLAGADGFLLWNATINYRKTLGWMAQLTKLQ